MFLKQSSEWRILNISLSLIITEIVTENESLSAQMLISSSCLIL